MSANDRRASYMNAQRPRVASNGVVDAEKGTPRNAGSPFPSDNMDQMRSSASSQKTKVPREQNATKEKHSERTTVNTREKVHARTRSSVKESTSAGNRGDREKVHQKKASHADVVSPTVRKEKGHTEGRSYLANLAMLSFS